MSRLRTIIAGTMLLALAPLGVHAQDMPEGFATGPVFTAFGPHAPVPHNDLPIAEGTEFRVAFDVASAAEGDARNRGFESAARLMNMLVANGVAEGDVHLAVVAHGGALRDLLTDEARAARDLGEVTPSGDMVREMMAHGVRFIVCGQSAAGLDIDRQDLIPGVEIALSAMAAHAQLQQQGYTLNPF